MRLLLIRHGDPDYEHDSLTPRGDREALLLSRRLAQEDITYFYVSPLGRARRTASYTLDAMGRSAQVISWMREFPARVDLDADPDLAEAYPDTQRGADGRRLHSVVWDIVPAYWRNRPEFYTMDGWRSTQIARNSDMERIYDDVCAGFDNLLSRHGYVRDGMLYRTEHGNNDTIAIFCHFGVTCVMLSHLWGVSPFVLWHSLVCAPTSVTEVYTEEREKGIVSFRATKVGDVSHLYAGCMEPAFAARFCENWDNENERH